MVLTPVVYAACLLDPHRAEEKMNPSEVSEAWVLTPSWLTWPAQLLRLFHHLLGWRDIFRR